MKSVILIYLYICTIFDIKEKEIPGVLICAGVILAFVTSTIVACTGNSNQRNGYLPYLVLGALLLLSKLKAGVGDADGFIFFIIGLTYGNQVMFESVLLSFLMCGIFSMGLLLFTKADKKKEIAFVPFIFLACTITYSLGRG